MSEMQILDRTGDTKVIWDKNNEAEVEAAKVQFDTLKKKGFAAFRAEGKNGEKGEQIREFDAKAERLILIPPMVGG